MGELLSMECSQPHVIPKLKTMKLLKIPQEGAHRYVVSVLKIIEMIHREYPDLEVQNLGAPDLIITYEGDKSEQKLKRWLKIVFITITSFIGAAFAIMTFNNDCEITKLFDHIYQIFLGRTQEGAGVLEVTYSIGITVGILVFFNHFGKKRFSVDPTPIEVEMRLYENDIQTTIIEDYSRKGHEIDVGKTDYISSHRT